jgi:ubiquinone/menaquinone biosynthesis C-methylase UbiE
MADFYQEKMTKIFTDKRSVLDIGGGLRVAVGRGDRHRVGQEWLKELVAKADYKIMDPVDTFHPDIVGDIHKMPFPDNSLDAIVCGAVLEHVEDPIRAANELHRTLKKGGYCYVYVPFLYYYHPEQGYYKDFWRFSEDAVRHIFRDFSSIEIEPIRGATETWLHLNPFTQKFELLGRVIDKLIGKTAGKTKQVSGFAAFMVK